MKLVNRHNRCVGITLFRWGRRQAEIWFCPKHEYIEPHHHPNIDSVLVVVAGEMMGKIADKHGLVHWRKDFLQRFPIPAGIVHSAAVGMFCVFINFETWKKDKPLTSAATDFTAV